MSNSPSPAALTATVLFLFAVAAFAVAAPAATSTGPGVADSATAAPGRGLPLQGLYEGCAPGAVLAHCEARLAEIRRTGFRYVLNYSSWYGSPDEVLRYADAAAALGLRLIWPLSHPAWRGAGGLGSVYSDLAHSLGLTDLGEAPSDTVFTAQAIDLVAGHPATWGFYIGDELPPAEALRVGELSATVRRLAPEKPQLYVARPGAARLEPFAALADVAGVDAYPLGSRDPPVQRAARTAREVAAAAGARTAMVLQAFSWSQYRPWSARPRYPSARHLRRMRDAAIRHARPSMILWYSYQDILRSDRPAHRWRSLTHAAFAPLG